MKTDIIKLQEVIQRITKASNTMKKAVMIIIAAFFIITMMASCNKNVCPAYVKDSPPEQTENNG